MRETDAPPSPLLWKPRIINPSYYNLASSFDSDRLSHRCTFVIFTLIQFLNYPGTSPHSIALRFTSTQALDRI